LISEDAIKLTNTDYKKKRDEAKGVKPAAEHAQPSA